MGLRAMVEIPLLLCVRLSDTSSLQLGGAHPASRLAPQRPGNPSPQRLLFISLRLFGDRGRSELPR